MDLEKILPKKGPSIEEVKKYLKKYNNEYIIIKCGGSAIIGQSDVRMIIKEFRNQVLESRRRLLIKKAHNLGGTDLVNKWIDLHVVGKKKDGLVQIAKELGFQ